MDVSNGWERYKRKHFDDIVANYDRIRPEYPCKLFEDIFNYSRQENGKKAIEIGAGTGKATAPLLDAGYNVTAIEIGVNMAEFLLDRFNGNNNFNVVNTSFEEAMLEDEGYDLIYAASAIHWVDAEIGCPKAFRLLKNGGTIALFRYNIVPSDGEELYEKIQSIYEQYYYSYYKSNKRPIKKSYKDYEKPSEVYIGFRFKDLKEYGFKDVAMKFYPAEMKYSADDYIAFLDTQADHRSLPESNRNALYTEIKDAILKHGGYYKIEYLFQLYLGRK